MNLCLDNGFLLNIVLGFLDPKSIMNFSLVNIKIKKILDPSTNEYINIPKPINRLNKGPDIDPERAISLYPKFTKLKLSIKSDILFP